MEAEAGRRSTDEATVRRCAAAVPRVGAIAPVSKIGQGGQSLRSPRLNHDHAHVRTYLPPLPAWTTYVRKDHPTCPWKRPLLLHAFAAIATATVPSPADAWRPSRSQLGETGQTTNGPTTRRPGYVRTYGDVWWCHGCHGHGHGPGPKISDKPPNGLQAPASCEAEAGRPTAVTLPAPRPRPCHR